MGFKCVLTENKDPLSLIINHDSQVTKQWNEWIKKGKQRIYHRYSLQKDWNSCLGNIRLQKCDTFDNLKNGKTHYLSLSVIISVMKEYLFLFVLLYES